MSQLGGIIKVPWTRQPTQPVQPNPALPIPASAVVFSQRRDMVATRFTLPEWEVTPRSIGICLNGTNTSNNALAIDVLTGGIPVTTNYTSIAIVELTLTGSNPGLWRDSDGIGGEMCIIQGANGLPWMRFANADVLKPSSGESVTAGQKICIAYRARGGVDASCWWNGAQKHVATTAASPGTTGKIRMIGWQTDNSQRIGHIAAWVHWQTALSDDHLASITKSIPDAWGQLFAP